MKKQMFEKKTQPCKNGLIEKCPFKDNCFYNDIFKEDPNE
jgi:hypothetical protein